MDQPCTHRSRQRSYWVRPALPHAATWRSHSVSPPHWLNRKLDEDKDLEIRSRSLSSGLYWLGCHGTVYGHCVLGSSILIYPAEALRGLRHRHRVGVDELPYSTTYGLEIRQCHRVTPTPYDHPRGAVGTVRFRRASTRHEGHRARSGGA